MFRNTHFHICERPQWLKTQADFGNESSYIRIYAKVLPHMCMHIWANWECADCKKEDTINNSNKFGNNIVEF